MSWKTILRCSIVSGLELGLSCSKVVASACAALYPTVSQGWPFIFGEGGGAWCTQPETGDREIDIWRSHANSTDRQCPLSVPARPRQRRETSGVWSQDVRLPWVHGSLAQTARHFSTLCCRMHSTHENNLSAGHVLAPHPPFPPLLHYSKRSLVSARGGRWKGWVSVFEIQQLSFLRVFFFQVISS